MDGFGVADVFDISIFIIFGGTFLILFVGFFRLLLLFFGFLVDCLERFLLSSLSISNCLLLGFLGFSILDLGLFGDHLIHLSMLLGLFYDLLGLDLGMIQVTFVMIFLVLQFLLGLLLFILSLSLFLVCFLLSVMRSLLGGLGITLSSGVIGFLGSLSSLFGGVILSFDCFSSYGCRAAAVLTVGIANGLGSGSIAILNFFVLFVFVGHGISLQLE